MPNGGSNNQEPQSNNVYGDFRKKEKEISIKICERNICIAPKKAKALDKRYEDLLTKICLKHEVPAELEILSHIKGMVYTA